MWSADRGPGGRYRRLSVRVSGTAVHYSVTEEAVPSLERGQLLIRVHRAGVAFGDILRARGTFTRPPPRPFTPGYDVSGEVLDVGADAGDFRVGDRVVAYTQTGGYAEVVAVPRHRAVAIPPGVAYDEAVAVVLNYVTARQMLRRVAGVRAGNVVLVQGAAGGVGTALLELGKLEGLRIYGTVSPAKLPMVEGLGAIPIDYRARDFVAEVRRAEPSGLDAAFESVSIENAYRSRSLLRPRGTLVYYGFVGMVSDPRYAGKGLRLGLDLARLRLSQGGTRTRIYAIDADRRKVWFREDLEAVLHLLREDRIHPVIQATYPLERAGEAHELLLSGGVAGKILLDCSG